jgi:hypothetical protein
VLDSKASLFISGNESSKELILFLGGYNQLSEKGMNKNRKVNQIKQKGAQWG